MNTDMWAFKEGKPLTRVDVLKLLQEAGNSDKLNLSGQSLQGIDLTNLDLRGANLSDADLRNANLSNALLTKADLRRTILIGTSFNGASLNDADFSEAQMGHTLFANNDLSTVKGLEYVFHTQPSSISIDTIYHSAGQIPELFLLMAGVPDSFITYMRSLATRSFDYYNCFISYSSKDEDFAKQLYSDLQSNGVRCWFASYDLLLGQQVHQHIDEAIRIYDKLLLILSAHSIASPWMEYEVEAALERERKERQAILFPIQLDDSIFTVNNAWAADILGSMHIANFTQWKEHKSYQRAFSHLIRDLKVTIAMEVNMRELEDEK